MLEQKTIILFTELYCKTLPFNLTAEHRLRVFQNTIQRNTFPTT